MMAHLYPLMLEAALRGLLAAAAVWAGLRLLRLANVLVLKAAWALVLVASVALPLAPRWQHVPASAALQLPAIFSVPQQSASNASASQESRPQVAASDGAMTSVETDSGSYSSPVISDDHAESAANREAIADDETAAALSADVQETRHQSAAPLPAILVPARATAANRFSLRVAEFCILLYLSVACALLLRLLLGLISAIRLWMTAERLSPLKDPSWSVRSSKRVASPVNIGSGIVLPAEYIEWDEEKLRIVLAHERSHIRQGDFYLQLLAGLYACIFWFSPLGWWLKRKLYELGEAISDRAGLEQAASRTSYAQLLLEFAALPRPTLTGVAMARTSHLSQRIERLLNESSFRQAFAGSGRRAVLAVTLVPIALLTATSLVNVQAATPLPEIQANSLSGQSTPEQVTDSAAAPAVAPASAPAPEAAPDAAPLPAAPQSPDHAVVPAPAEPPAPAAPMHLEDGSVVVVPHVQVNPRLRVHPQIAAMPPLPPIDVHVLPFAYGFGQDGDPYAVVGSDGKVVTPNGGFFYHDSGRQAEIDKARMQAHGAFLWFRHDGKPYIVDDPAVVSQIEAMNKPMQDLQSQMHDLGKQMRELGNQQREKGHAMRDAAVQTPDLSKELAALKAAEASLQAKQGGTITQREIGDLQREIGRIQGELGSLQGKLMMQQSGIGKNMAEFGEQQGKLGGQMGKLGAEMGRIARENQEKIKGIIDQSLSNGKAKQVQ
jgi:beta-lactamase regulating signal transducer with metallopeptidase domain